MKAPLFLYMFPLLTSLTTPTEPKVHKTIEPMATKKVFLHFYKSEQILIQVMQPKQTILSLILLCLPFLSFSQKIAVLEFKPGVGVSISDVDGLSSIFTTYFAPSGYTLIERSQIDRVIDEQQFQRSSLSERQMVRIGEILNLSKIVVGNINIVMGEYNVDVRVINVESGTITATEGSSFSSGSYREGMKNLAQGLARKISITPVASSHNNEYTYEPDKEDDAKPFYSDELAARAAQGNVKAQYELGVCYFSGEAINKDYNVAIRWFRKAAEQGYAKAQCELGDCYFNGIGVSTDQSEAFRWYKKAAEQGYALAQSRLGHRYFYGLGINKNYYEGVRWWRKAAEQGEVYAQYCLGDCYLNGLGVSKDYNEAVKWWKKAAGQGFELAIKALRDLGKY